MAKFEIYKSDSGKHYFRLKSGNGQTILASQGYANKAGAKNGVESVRKNAARDGGAEMFEGKNGKHYFRLKSTNGQTVATSQGYASAAGAKTGLASVQKNATDAEVTEVASTGEEEVIEKGG